MKKSGLFLSIFMLSMLLFGCGEKENFSHPSLEEASICPEGFYRADSAKSCIFVEELN